MSVKREYTRTTTGGSFSGFVEKIKTYLLLFALGSILLWHVTGINVLDLFHHCDHIEQRQTKDADGNYLPIGYSEQQARSIPTQTSKEEAFAQWVSSYEAGENAIKAAVQKAKKEETFPATFKRGFGYTHNYIFEGSNTWYIEAGYRATDGKTGRSNAKRLVKARARYDRNKRITWIDWGIYTN